MTKITLPSKDLIQIDGEIKNFTYKQKLREFSTTKPALQQMLKEHLESGTQEKEATYKNKPPKLRKW